MKIKVTRHERQQIQDNRDLVDRIANADLVGVTCGGWTRLFLMRPIEEVPARDLPGKVTAIEFEAADVLELEEYRAIVNRMKGAVGCRHSVEQLARLR